MLTRGEDYRVPAAAVRWSTIGQCSRGNVGRVRRSTNG